MAGQQVYVEFGYHKASDVLKVGLFVSTFGHKLIKLGHIVSGLLIAVGSHQIAAAVNQTAWLFRCGCRCVFGKCLLGIVDTSQSMCLHGAGVADFGFHLIQIYRVGLGEFQGLFVQ